MFQSKTIQSKRVDLKCGGSGGCGGLRRVTFFSPFWKLPQFLVKYECFINSEWPSALFKIQRVFFCPLFSDPPHFEEYRGSFQSQFSVPFFKTLRILKNTEGLFSPNFLSHFLKPSAFWRIQRVFSVPIVDILVEMHNFSIYLLIKFIFYKKKWKIHLPSKFSQMGHKTPHVKMSKS